MPLLGAHLSIAGGHHRALEEAALLRMDAVQIFTKSSNQWAARPLTESQTRLFRSVRRKLRIRRALAHDSYLINLASPDRQLYRRSVQALAEELTRAEALGLDALIMHPGAATGDDEASALERVAQALTEILQNRPTCRVRVLVETTAGQGSALGYRFEHLAYILQRLPRQARAGVCVDTCHIFAAGYPLAPAGAYRATMEQLDRIVGLKRVFAFHLNDSARPLGSRVDRHEHIGQGYMGVEPFRLLLNDPRFHNMPMVLETPKSGPNGEPMDPVNLAILRSLMDRPA
ncbi:MAG: deoxyribonuclease IV [Gemmataceae bacterium]